MELGSGHLQMRLNSFRRPPIYHRVFRKFLNQQVKTMNFIWATPRSIRNSRYVIQIIHTLPVQSYFMLISRSFFPWINIPYHMIHIISSYLPSAPNFTAVPNTHFQLTVFMLPPAVVCIRFHNSWTPFYSSRNDLIQFRDSSIGGRRWQLLTTWSVVLSLILSNIIVVRYILCWPIIPARMETFALAAEMMPSSYLLSGIPGAMYYAYYYKNYCGQVFHWRFLSCLN